MSTTQQPFFDLTQDGVTIRVYDNEGSCMTDYESSKEPLETETFFDWCKNSYSFEVLPLYRALNEQRTQGEWAINQEENTLSKYRVFTTKGGANVMWIDPDDESIENEEANAQYTALAVNNLASLAEALQLQIDEWHSVDSNFHKEEPPSLKAAREALTRIS